MNDDAKSTVWIGACRYYMGRMTYAVGNFCDALRKEWPTLPEHTKAIIKRDVEEGFKRDDESRSMGDKSPYVVLPLGHDCDRREWEEVRKLWQ